MGSARLTKRVVLLCGLLALALGGCGKRASEAVGDAADGSAPQPATLAANAAVGEALALEDPRDFADARRGLIAAAPDLRVMGSDGTPIWNAADYAFIEGAAPDSVNPSLWRQARLNNINGLFEVAPGIYQLRGFDLSNMSIIVGETGWIIVDPLTARETAARALAFAREHLGERPVTAILFTHSHVDHFGGVLGIATPEEVRARGIRVIAPEGFLEEATSENILAGTTMGRRATYMYGRDLPRSPRGHVDTGLGKGPAFGSAGILIPSETVSHTGEEKLIDGVRFVFQSAPGSEAPAEFTFYLPDRKAFCGAEVVSHTMHNLYTLRGAKVRDALKWSGYIDEELQLFGDAEVYFASHHWPLWGNATIREFLAGQRDTYRFIHDQTLRLAARGHTPQEIADALQLPASLARNFANRGYYGTLKHNAKAVYQFYFGWYDANPAHLDPLAPGQAARRYLEYMGGADAVLQRARADYARGEYRWVAEVLDRVVFAEPDNAQARELLARSYEQLGYQAESGPWRDVYLSGARELRHGVTAAALDIAASADLLRQAPVARFLDAMALRLDPHKAAGEHEAVNLVFSDSGESHVLEIENAVLHHRQQAPRADAIATLRLSRDLFLRMMLGQVGIRETLGSDELEVEGSTLKLLAFFARFDKPDPSFNIVTP